MYIPMLLAFQWLTRCIRHGWRKLVWAANLAANANLLLDAVDLVRHGDRMLLSCMIRLMSTICLVTIVTNARKV